MKKKTGRNERGRSGLTIAPEPDIEHVASQALVISHCRNYAGNFFTIKYGAHDVLTYAVPRAVLLKNSSYAEVFTEHIEIAMRLHNPPEVIIVTDEDEGERFENAFRDFQHFKMLVNVACVKAEISSQPPINHFHINCNRQWNNGQMLYSFPGVPMDLVRITCIDPRLSEFYYSLIEISARLAFPGSAAILYDEKASQKERAWVAANLRALRDNPKITTIEVDGHQDCKRYPVKAKDYSEEKSKREHILRFNVYRYCKRQKLIGKGDWRIRCVPLTRSLATVHSVGTSVNRRV